MNIKMVINSTCDYCALYDRTMHVILADGTMAAHPVDDVT